MTIEQLIKLFGEQPALFSDVLKHVASTEEGKELLNNYAKTQAEKAAGDKATEIYGGIDATLKEIFGTDRPTEKQTADYLKDLATELKTLKAKKDDGKGGANDNARITELEKELDNFKKGDWEGKYHKLTAETATKLSEYETKLQKAQEENVTGLVGIELTAALAGVKFNPNIPQELIDNYVGSIKAKVMKNAKIVDGKPVFYNEDGTPWNNQLYKPITANEIIANELKSVIATDGNKGGGAAPTAGDFGKIVTIGEGEAAKKRVALDPTKFNTKLSFAEHSEKALLEGGIERNSKEWHEITSAAYNEYGVDKMERV